MPMTNDQPFCLPPLGALASAEYSPVEPALRDRLRSVAVPTLSAVMFQMGLHTRFFRGLRPLDAGKPRFCGAAWTLRAIPVREDIRTAMSARTAPSLNRLSFDAAPSGCVIACGSGGHPDISFMGDIMATALVARHVAGVVLDLGVSDASLVADMALPVVCAGRDAVSSFSAVMVVGCNEAIGIQGVAVFPGDIIVGDADGAICLPRHLAEEVAARAEEQERMERFIITLVHAGVPIDIAYPPDEATLAAYRDWLASGPSA